MTKYYYRGAVTTQPPGYEWGKITYVPMAWAATMAAFRDFSANGLCGKLGNKLCEAPVRPSREALALMKAFDGSTESEQAIIEALADGIERPRVLTKRLRDFAVLDHANSVGVVIYED